MKLRANKMDTATASYLRQLYPQVESLDILPTSWSKKDKFTFIGLSKQDLRVHYKGIGKTHKDAASVRTNQPIPVACGVFYFEVKVLSKGRDGYMGVGLSQANVSLNRLPGWDKHSYGYHGDDGHSFCSSGTGKPYGPTFTTLDIIGCGVNLLEKTCFYTKNGINLGVAFGDLPNCLYPTVGLQTPGEVVEANFGQQPFKFDIETEMLACRTKLYKQIETYGGDGGQRKDDDQFINQVVLSYLIHHGFTETAEAFSKSSDIAIKEDLSTVRKRQHLQKLILGGRMSEATDFIDTHWSDVLVYDELLILMVKIRQFIEMVSGHDTPSMSGGSSPKQGSVGDSKGHECNGEAVGGSESNGKYVDEQMIEDDEIRSSNGEVEAGLKMSREDAKDEMRGGSSSEDMDVEEHDHGDVKKDVMNGRTNVTEVKNGKCVDDEFENGESMDVPQEKEFSGSHSPKRWEKLLEFGRQLQELYDTISGGDTSHPYDSVLKDAFSLLAYADPYSSPLSHLLSPDQREHVWSTVNSAILVQQNKTAQPSLDRLLVQIRDLTQQLVDSGSGACAFMNASSYFK